MQPGGLALPVRPGHQFLRQARRVEGRRCLQYLLAETVEADLEAMALELKALLRTQAQTAPRDPSKRAPLPANLPRTEAHHEPALTLRARG
jgi:transposase